METMLELNSTLFVPPIVNNNENTGVRDIWIAEANLADNANEFI